MDQSLAEHEAWLLRRRPNETRGPLLSKDFRGATLTDKRLDLADLGGADFSGATLRKCSFCHAYLSGADFYGATLEGVDFDRADLSGADFSKVALLRDIDFFNANLTGAKLPAPRYRVGDVVGEKEPYLFVRETSTHMYLLGPSGRVFTMSIYHKYTEFP